MKKYLLLFTLLFLGFSAVHTDDIYDQELETENPTYYWIGSFDKPDIDGKTLFNNDKIIVASHHVKISFSAEIAPYIIKNKIQIRHKRTTYTVNTNTLINQIQGTIAVQSDRKNAPFEEIEVTISASN